MTEPINQRSEAIKRELAMERLLQDCAALPPAPGNPDPTQHANSENGAPAAWALLVVILFVVGLALGRLFWVWVAAGR
jgi:hypothetical protein